MKYNKWTKEKVIEIAQKYEYFNDLRKDYGGLYKISKDNGWLKEFTWLKNNAHKYGFILRYQKNAEKITGYIYEPWHYRYVGTELASYIYSNNITYDEMYLKKKISYTTYNVKTHSHIN